MGWLIVFTKRINCFFFFFGLFLIVFIFKKKKTKIELLKEKKT